MQLVRKEKLYLNPVVYDMIEKTVGFEEKKDEGETTQDKMQVQEPEDEYGNIMCNIRG